MLAKTLKQRPANLLSGVTLLALAFIFAGVYVRPDNDAHHPTGSMTKESLPLIQQPSRF